MSKMYVVHVLDEKGKLQNVSYTNDFDLASKYAELHGLSEKHILRLSESQLDKYLETINPDEVSVDVIQEIEGLALTIGELEWVSNSAADTVYEIMNNLGSIRSDLKYFKGIEYDELREAIDKFVKAMGQKQHAFSDRLLRDLKRKKFAKNALLDFL